MDFPIGIWSIVLDNPLLYQCFKYEIYFIVGLWNTCALRLARCSSWSRGEALSTRKAIFLAMGGLVSAKRTRNTCSVFRAVRASRAVTYKEASHNYKLIPFEMFGTAIQKGLGIGISVHELTWTIMVWAKSLLRSPGPGCLKQRVSLYKRFKSKLLHFPINLPIQCISSTVPFDIVVRFLPQGMQDGWPGEGW